MQLVRFDPATAEFRTLLVDSMKSSTCVMSTAACLESDGRLLAAWETEGDIKVRSVAASGAKPREALRLPPGSKRKHPALALNHRGQLLVAWAEGTGWMQGGAVAWQVFDEQGSPIRSAHGRTEGLPVWGLPAAWARPDGTFVVAY